METAVVLAAGRGTRMRQDAPGVELTREQTAAADAGLKMLVPLNGRPFLAYVLDELAAAGFREVCLVVRPEDPSRPGAADPVREAALSLDTPLRLRFVVQPEPRGGADAVLASEPVVGSQPFLVINADNVYPAEVLRSLREIDGAGLAAFERDALVRRSNIPPERVAAFAVIRQRDGWLTEIREKPSPDVLARWPDARVSMTCWRFDPSIFDACRRVSPSPRGELELPDAVALDMERGTRFRVVPVAAGVLDISSRADIPALERRLAGGDGTSPGIG